MNINKKKKLEHLSNWTKLILMELFTKLFIISEKKKTKLI